MTKLKAPLLGLDASGSIGDAITFRRSHGQTIAENKPTPTDPRTLPQIYHRWEYQDYAAWWQTLTPAVKAGWEMAGRRFHLTGFNLWMRYRLSLLSDIIGRWRLDEPGGAHAADSSKNLIHATVYGALPTPGRISLARYFDGVDDYIDCTPNALLHVTSPFSFEAWAHPLDSGGGGYGRLIELGGEIISYITGAASQDLTFRIWMAGAQKVVTSTGSALSWGNTHHIVCVWDGANVILFVDTVKFTGDAAVGVKDTTLTNHLMIGNTGALIRTWHGWIDHCTFYNRALTQPEVNLRYERTYP